MRQTRPGGRAAVTIAILSFAVCAASGAQAASKADHKQRQQSVDSTTTQHADPARRGAAGHHAANHGKLDRSGRAKVGKASFYARRFAGRKMADGTPMRPGSPNAASKTLPLGTVAKVTNLDNGVSTEVTIQDRGPYVAGRIIDLPPSKAQEIGITQKKGVAPVEVAPIAVPTPDGGVKPGEGATNAAATRGGHSEDRPAISK